MGRVTAGSLAKRIKELNGDEEQYHRELDVLCGIRTRPNGSRTLNRRRAPILTATSHSWSEIGEAICGRDVFAKLKDTRFGRMRGGRWQAPVAEDAGAGAMGPSQFQAINYWSDTVAKILEAVQLMQYEQPEFIGDKVTTLKPGVVMNVGRRPRYSPPTTKTRHLQPNEPIPMGSMDAEWVDVNPLEKHGQGLAIATETMLFDGNQGAAVEAIGNISYQIGWSKEDRIIRPVWGIESTYRYGAADSGGTTSSFATYGTNVGAGTLPVPYTNEIGPLDLADEIGLDSMEQIFLGLKNPRTGYPINMDGERMMLVTPAKWMTARRLSRITTVEQGPRAAAPAGVEITEPTWTGPMIKPMFSQRAYDLMQQDFPEYGWAKLTAAKAAKRIIYGNPKKAFEYREARPFQSWNWNIAQDPSLALHDTFMIVVALEQGSVTIVEPRHCMRVIKDDATLLSFEEMEAMRLAEEQTPRDARDAREEDEDERTLLR